VTVALNSLLFDERKAGQAAAFLLHKAGGQLTVLKLIKLMYLAERESLRRYGDTITGDSFVSMPHGPVTSAVLDHINDLLPSSDPRGWKFWVADRADNNLALREPGMVSNPEQDLLALSETDLECLDAVWTQFGGMSGFQLREYTHGEGCPEWENPNGSSRPIPMGKLLMALGYQPDQVSAIIKRQHEQRYINAAFHAAGS
jgi:uncharacterized phage-associated protein